MHKLKSLLYLFLIGMVSLTACKDDDVPAGPKVAENTVSINDKTFNLNQAILVEGDNSGTTSDNYYLFMMSTAGDDFVVFSFYTPKGQTAIAGTYNAAAATGTAANSFNGSYIGINCTEDSNGEANCEDEFMTGNAPTGSLTITKDGNIFTVNFDVKYTDGGTNTDIQGLGNYKGSIFGAE